MKLNIYGDFCPTGSNIEFFKAGEYAKVFGRVCALNHTADYNIVNLECALGSKGEAVEKVGPSLAAPIECISGLAKAGFHVVSVANNHSLDNGIVSFEEELSALEHAGLTYVGANTKDGTKDCIFVGEGAARTAIFSIGDQEFNTDECGYGVSIFSDHRTYTHIYALKQQVQHVIVIYHSGYENASYPSPQLMKRCRAMVECGASAVLCQHSHCIGAYEEHQGSLIVYGQGNFLFDLTDRESWHRGLCVSMDIDENGIKYEFVPLAVKNGCIVELSDGECESVIGQFMSRSREISDLDFVSQRWKEFLKSEAWKYNAMLRGGAKRDYVVWKVLSWIKSGLCLNKRQMTTYLLFMRSDTHREALSDLLQMERKRNP